MGPGVPLVGGLAEQAPVEQHLGVDAEDVATGAGPLGHRARLAQRVPEHRCAGVSVGALLDVAPA